MSETWPPGTIVVCVDDRVDPDILPYVTWTGAPLKEGEYYTVAAEVERLDGPGLFLSECTVSGPFCAMAFRKDRFRRAESSHNEVDSLKVGASS